MMPVRLDLIIRRTANDVSCKNERLEENRNWVRFAMWLDCPNYVPG